MNNEQKRTVLAFAISGIILFSWNAFFAPKNDAALEQKVLQDNAIERSANVDSSKFSNDNQALPVTKPLNQNVSVNDNISSVELVNGDYSFLINTNFSFSDAKGFDTNINLETLSDHKAFYQVYLVNQNNNLVSLNLSFEEIAGSSYITGYDQLNDVKVSFNLEDNGKLNYTILSSNPVKLAVKMFSKEKKEDNGKIRDFQISMADFKRMTVGSDYEGDGKTKWIGLDFHHHLFANVFSEKVISKYTADEKGVFTFVMIDPATKFDGYFIFALKNYDYLSSFKNQLDLSIDFGLFSIFAIPILKGMQWIYKYVGNYGLAIIILTFIIRFLTFPLQFKSFKSMKKMQVVQPEIAKLKERYKDDPQKLQRETMELFKKAGANPLGGCLPMLLQVPIFIAFYQAINNSVDLVGAPFYFWIFDLSAKDPYYVLPVLMGITMLAQTKLNPSTTADPNQQKLMYLMPLVFCFIMKDLPAGLNLYFCISNTLGVGQQLLVYKAID